MATIAFGTKDIGGFQVAEPIVRLAIERGHGVIIAAEGFSIAEWKKAGFGLHFEGTKDFASEPFEFNAEEFLKNHKPDAVVVTYGAPINIEEKLAQVATRYGAPLIGIEDVWGAALRIDPDMFDTILTQEFGREVLKELAPNTKAMIIETGSPFVASMMQNAVPPEIAEIFERRERHHRFTVLIAGDDDETQHYLHWALASIAKSRNSEAFLPIWRAHPRTFASEKDKEVWFHQVELWKAIRGTNQITTMPEIKDTRFIARLADITVSNYGTLFLASAVAGKIPVRVRSELGDALMKKYTGLDFYPMVRVGKRPIGAALEFDWGRPVDLCQHVLAKKDKLEGSQKKHLKFSANAAGNALDWIEELIRRKMVARYYS